MYCTDGKSKGDSTTLSRTVVQGLDAANPAGPTSFDGCSALTNAAAVAGNIALLDRGTCGFTIKVKNAREPNSASTEGEAPGR